MKPSTLTEPLGPRRLHDPPPPFVTTLPGQNLKFEKIFNKRTTKWKLSSTLHRCCQFISMNKKKEEFQISKLPKNHYLRIKFLKNCYLPIKFPLSSFTNFIINFSPLSHRAIITVLGAFWVTFKQKINKFKFIKNNDQNTHFASPHRLLTRANNKQKMKKQWFKIDEGASVGFKYTVLNRFKTLI